MFLSMQALLDSFCGSCIFINAWTVLLVKTAEDSNDTYNSSYSCKLPGLFYKSMWREKANLSLVVKDEG